MRAKITFAGVTEFFQDTTDVVRVALGKSFDIAIVDPQPGLTMATTEDPVLSVRPLGGDTTNGDTIFHVDTTFKGTSKLILLNSGLSAVFYLDIEVFDEQAVSLNPVAGAPELK